jgi:hypothetical protein
MGVVEVAGPGSRAPSQGALRACACTVCRPAQAHPPIALAELELAQPGCAKLGDQGGQQFIGQPRDLGVVDEAGGLIAIGHGSDLLASRRLVV